MNVQSSHASKLSGVLCIFVSCLSSRHVLQGACEKIYCCRRSVFLHGGCPRLSRLPIGLAAAHIYFEGRLSSCVLWFETFQKEQLRWRRWACRSRACHSGKWFFFGDATATLFDRRYGKVELGLPLYTKLSPTTKDHRFVVRFCCYQYFRPLEALQKAKGGGGHTGAVCGGQDLSTATDSRRE